MADAIAALARAAEVAATAVMTSGPAEERATPTAPLTQCDIDTLKRQAPLSIFAMADGTYRFVPRKGAVRAPAGGEISLAENERGRERYGHVRERHSVDGHR